MSKKVLILSASPRRRGNSDLLCDEFLKGAKEAGHQAEKIFLDDKDINFCNGCGLCFNNKGTCSQKDDMGEILQKMIEADVIAMATPVYFYTMNAQMKVLIDRTCAAYTTIKNKDFYFIATAADGNKNCAERTIEGFRAFMDCLEGANEKNILSAIGVWNIGDVKNTHYMKEAYELGKHV